jgi:hypothetical protein
MGFVREAEKHAWYALKIKGQRSKRRPGEDGPAWRGPAQGEVLLMRTPLLSAPVLLRF